MHNWQRGHAAADRCAPWAERARGKGAEGACHVVRTMILTTAGVCVPAMRMPHPERGTSVIHLRRCRSAARQRLTGCGGGEQAARQNVRILDVFFCSISLCCFALPCSFYRLHPDVCTSVRAAHLDFIESALWCSAGFNAAPSCGAKYSHAHSHSRHTGGTTSAFESSTSSLRKAARDVGASGRQWRR